MIPPMAEIRVKNARENNLRGINIDIPRDKLVVFTGVSGSGKSSLLFNTVYAEAQRQYVESLGIRARKRLPKFARPKVDEISGISAAIVLDQKRLGRNLRSTVGTVTEIYTYLRLLFSRCGTPRIGDSTLFSFNTPEGMCPTCRGLGEKLVLDKNRVFDWKKTLNEGAILYSEYRVGGRRWNILKISQIFDMNRPLKEFSKEEVEKLLFSEKVELASSGQDGYIQGYSFEGIITGIKRRRLDKRGTFSSTLDKDKGFFNLEYCDDCEGSRLNKEARGVRVNGRTVSELVRMELSGLLKFMRTVRGPVGRPIAEKIEESLSHLCNIGVGYLSLDRPVSTLSGGESQRVKMARQLGVNLIEMMYILDEPSVGLHPRDIHQLMNILKELRDKGNSVLVVEHDKTTIEAADWVIDLGPGAGSYGGEVVFAGSVKELKKAPGSVTGKFLKKTEKIEKKVCRKGHGVISVKNGSLHNLKGINVDIPQGVFVCVTGVAGSGKSTLINEILVKDYPEAVVVDQSGVGRSVRSNSATYIGVFGLIRKLFARTTGEEAGLFSFNSSGACSKCKGLGYKKVEMHFLDSVQVECAVCEGKRYREGVLKMKYKGKNIAEVLKMTVLEAFDFFEVEEIKRRLELLRKVGLGYLELGQSLDTLSGGEVQRIKLVKELHKGGKIYVLDEPTTGLHAADIERLVKVLNKMVDKGNTVIVIEHNLDVVAQADWIIDLGPEGGVQGGEIMAQGTPREVAGISKSHTGRYLAEYFRSFGRKW